MPEFLTTGCVLACSMGAAQSPFIALDLPGKPAIDGALPAATIEEMAPMDNILPFGMCKSLENPEVAAATAAAYGELTPMPCIPIVEMPWEPGSVLITYDGVPLALATDKCLCTWGGEISVQEAVGTTLTAEG